MFLPPSLIFCSVCVSFYRPGGGQRPGGHLSADVRRLQGKVRRPAKPQAAAQRTAVHLHLIPPFATPLPQDTPIEQSLPTPLPTWTLPQAAEERHFVWSGGCEERRGYPPDAPLPLEEGVIDRQDVALKRERQTEGEGKRETTRESCRNKEF